MEDKKNIKKIDEFIDNLSDFDYDRTEYTKEEIDQYEEEGRIRIKENIAKLGIKRKRAANIDKDTYNKIINGLRDKGELTLTYDEINKKHMELFNSPYIEPKNNKSNNE